MTIPTPEREKAPMPLPTETRDDMPDPNEKPKDWMCACDMSVTVAIGLRCPICGKRERDRA